MISFLKPVFQRDRQLDLQQSTSTQRSLQREYSYRQLMEDLCNWPARPGGPSARALWDHTGGGVSPDGSKWLQVNKDQLFHPLPAKRQYKKRYVDEIRKAGLYDQMPYGVLKKDWVVNIKPVGSGEAVLKYLAPYVYRIAITNHRMSLPVTDDEVVYKVKPSGKRCYHRRKLSGERFVRAFARRRSCHRGFRKSVTTDS